MHKITKGMGTTSSSRVEWITGHVGVGQEVVTQENAIEVAREEIGPCYSRMADDCMRYDVAILEEKGLFTTKCDRIRQAFDVSETLAWNNFMEEIPFCPGYFDYDSMPNGRGQGTGIASAPSGKKSGGGLVTAASIGLLIVAAAVIFS